jgi:hypothetical protein
MNLDPVRRVLDSLGASYVLIGGHALAARGYPRFTVDVDLLTTDARVLTPEAWAGLQQNGAAIDVRRGDADDPLGGVVHIVLLDGSDVDVILGKWRWLAQVIERAELMTVAGTEIGVPTIGDLILLKLTAGGYIDLQDAAALLAVADRQAVIGEVDAHIEDVQPDVRPLWRDLLARTGR